METINITSARDFGMQFSTYQDRGTAYALRAPEFINNFPECEPEDWAEFNNGCIQRKADITSPVVYLRDGVDSYTKLEGKAPKGADKLELSVGYVMSMSSQQAGSLKKTQPNLHRLVMALRKEVGQYCSNKRTALVRMYKAATAQPRTRDINKKFTEWLDETVANIVKRGRTAATREQDPTLSDKRVIAEMIASRLK